MLMQLMQVDPRLMDVFKELTGIDLMDMQSQQMKNKDKQEEMRKKAEEEAAKRKAEDEKRRKEEEEAALPSEEKEKIARKKAAEAKKNEGNEAYKNKKFEDALALYGEAIALDETDLTYYTNKAAVYLEMKEFDKCLEECDRAIEKSH